MATTKNHRNAQIETHRRGRLSEKSWSFQANTVAAAAAPQIRRPKTVPDLVSDRRHAAVTTPDVPPRQPPKLLLKVMMIGSLGPVQLVMRPEATVGDLVAAAVRQYVKECRRPILPSNNPSDFDLHYSQFSLESLDREEKLTEVGSRNFFLCPRKSTTTVTVDGGSGREGSVTTPFTSCAKEAKGGFAWLRFMNFLL